MRLRRIFFVCVAVLSLFFAGPLQFFVYASSSWTQNDWSSSSSYTSITNIATSSATLNLSASNHWYNSSWKYRQQFSVANGSGSTLTDFQIPVFLNTSSLITASKMKNDCSDLRITDATGSALPYWIATAPDANKCDQTTTKIWVKPASLSTAGETLYIYYGNSSASSESNGNNVFTRFADFTTGTSLPSGWTKKDIGTSGTATVGDGELTITNVGGVDVWVSEYGATHVYNETALTGSFIAETILTDQTAPNEWAKSGISLQNEVALGNTSTGNGQAFMITTPSHYVPFQYQSTDGQGCTDDVCSNVVAANVNIPEPPSNESAPYPTLLRLVKDESNRVSGYYLNSDVEDWTQQGDTITPWGISSTQYITLFATPHTASLQGSGSFAFIYVRKYASSMPTVGNPSSETTPYSSNGTMTSTIFDTGGSTNFGILTYTASTSANTSVSVKTRSSNNSDMSGANDFSSCTAVNSGDDISSNSCVSDGNRYLQYQVTLSSTDNVSTPTFENISIEYELTGNQSSSSTDNSSASNTSTPQAPQCGDTKPEKAPDLFQINANQTSATLYFTPSNTDSYVLSYSTNKSAEEYGASINLGSDGVQQYTVNLLEPGKTYYFKVRGHNGCMPGEWSNIMSAPTIRGIYYKNSPPTTNYQLLTTSNHSVLGEQTTIPQPSVITPTTPPSQISPTSLISPIAIQRPMTKKSCFLLWCW